MNLHIKKTNCGELLYEAVSENCIEVFEEQPSLDTLREFARNHESPTDRLDIIDSPVTCTECESQFDSRFGATLTGDLICWECAMSETGETEQGVTRTTDPAKVVLSESGLHHKSLCDYVINVATGCSHGCEFCYVPSTPNVAARQDMLNDRADVEDGQQEWGSYLLYRDDLPERLARTLDRKQKWNSTSRGRGVVMLSSGTDCYQDRRTAQITRGCVSELVKRHIPVRILTRSPTVCRDLDLYKTATEKTSDGMLVRVGSSIPCLDEKQVRAIEPSAPIPSARLDALQTLSDAGVPVYVSMSPTYPTQDRNDFDNLMSKFAELEPEVVFHEPINPRGANFQMTIDAARDSGQDNLADELEALRNREQWVKYSLKQMRWAEKLGAKYDIDVHVWPDKQVMAAVGTGMRENLQNQREKPSPEHIPEVSLSS